MTRLFDILFSGVSLVIFLPVFTIVAVLIKWESKGPILFHQERIGKNTKPFKILKFRTMFLGSDKKGLLTVGGRDSRITRVGIFLRKYKIDELPQLVNVLKGDMSIVGPRPEVEKYVKLYTPEQSKVLTVRPGISDFASIEFRNENEILSNADDPEKIYIEEVMQKKLELNQKFISDPSISNYFMVIFKTIAAVFSK